MVKPDDDLQGAPRIAPSSASFWRGTARASPTAAAPSAVCSHRSLPASQQSPSRLFSPQASSASRGQAPLPLPPQAQRLPGQKQAQPSPSQQRAWAQVVVEAVGAGFPRLPQALAEVVRRLERVEAVGALLELGVAVRPPLPGLQPGLAWRLAALALPRWRLT
jgi:hypothetical protein